MKKLLLAVLALSAFGSMAQDLAFGTLEAKSAICRLFSFQSGKGQLVVAATGGMPTYTYEWTYLVDGSTSSLTTWSNRAPGDYKIKVTDAAGDSIVDYITIDSITPVASFVPVVDMTAVPGGFISFSPVATAFANYSTGIVGPNEPTADTNFVWNFDYPDGTPQLQDNYLWSDWIYYGPGEHTVSLTASNSNGCADTAFVGIGIFGPLDVEDHPEQYGYTVWANSQANTLSIKMLGFDNPLDMAIYNLSGQLVEKFEASNGLNEVPFHHERGVYIYNLLDPSTGKVIGEGKVTK